MESLRRRLELSDSELFRVLLDWPSLLSMHYEDTVAPTLSTLELRLNLSVIELKRIVVEAPRVLSCPEELTKRLTQLQHHLHLTDDELKARLLERPTLALPTLALPPHRPASAQRTAAARMGEALGEVGGRKRAMRAAMRALVRALPPAAIDTASAAACERALAVLEGCERIGVFISMESECRTATLIGGLLARGARVYVPRVAAVGDRAGDRVGDVRDVGVMQMLELRGGLDEIREMPRNKWGVPEPEARVQPTGGPGVRAGAEAATGVDVRAEGLDAPSGLLDAVLVPALAFDARCNRLGRGMGYYDRYLASLQAARMAHGLPSARLVGLGLQEQLVERVPVEAHDVALHSICLPEMSFHCE